jgi:hypothetical protein
MLGNTVCDRQAVAAARAHTMAHSMSTYNQAWVVLMRFPLQRKSDSGKPY